MMTVTAATIPAHIGQTSFGGIFRGEWRKVVLQNTTRIGTIVGAVPLLLFCVGILSVNDIRNGLHSTGAGLLILQVMEQGLSLVRIFIGFLLIVITVQLIGLDYQQGTIRIILARGATRIQLLLAKLAAVGTLALAIFVGYMVLVTVGISLTLASMAGSFGILGQSPSFFWHDLLIYAGSMLLSMAATILLATVATVLVRSVAFGMSFALLFFPVINFLAGILSLFSGLTGSDLWLKVSTYLLGPALDILPGVLLPAHMATVGGMVRHVSAAFTVGTSPSVHYDATHYLTVICIYMVCFAAVAFILMQKRDVNE